MSNIFPTTWFGSVGSAFAIAVTVGLGVAGAALALWLERRQPRRGWLAPTTAVTLGLAVLAHALTAWVLALDTHRDAGRIPLPAPFGAIAAGANLVLIVVAPLFGGAVLGALLAGAGRVERRALLVLALLVAAYALWISPWVAYVLFD